MRRLLLLRHAKSSWKDASLDDFDRPLNKRGERDAPVMAGRLLQRGIRPERVVASPAKRAKRTAKLFAEVMEIPGKRIRYDERIYEAGVATLMQVIADFDDDRDFIMLVGHNPGLTLLANALAGDVTDNLPTSGVVDLFLDIGRWRDVAPGCGTCGFCDYPKRPQRTP